MISRGLTLAAVILVAASAPAWPTDEQGRRTPPKIDPNHPVVIHEQYYPRESVSANEQGRCQISVLVDVDGHIRASELRSSTGYPRLDVACLISVQNERMQPARLNGEPVMGWYTMEMGWGVHSGSKPMPPMDLTPEILADAALPVGPRFYPEESRARKEHGSCLVKVVVGVEGNLIRAELATSTGSQRLDSACTAAFNEARFKPALKDGAPKAAAALFAIYWPLH